MCGIVYLHSITGSPVNRDVLSAYKHQMHRGRDGFGFYIPGRNTLRHSPAEARIKELLSLPDMASSEILFHHRMPTSTKNVKNACHPFTTKAAFSTERQYVLVHNGYLYNASELKRDHEKRLGVSYVSTQPDGRFNDSEALLYDVAAYLEGRQDKLNMQGMAAFIAMQRDLATDQTTHLHFARNDYPLKLVLKKGVPTRLTSEGKGELIKAHTLYTYEYATGKLTTKPLRLPSDNPNWTYYSNPTTTSVHTPATANTANTANRYENIVRPSDTRYATSPDIQQVAADMFMEAHCDYSTAIVLSDRKRKHAESNFYTLEGEAELLETSAEREANMDEQMKAVLEIGHYQAVSKTLTDWQSEDATCELPLTTKEATNA